MEEKDRSMVKALWKSEPRFREYLNENNWKAFWELAYSYGAKHYNKVGSIYYYVFRLQDALKEAGIKYEYHAGEYKF